MPLSKLKYIKIKFCQQVKNECPEINRKQGQFSSYMHLLKITKIEEVEST